MALRTRVWTAGKLLLLAGALVATYILFAAASMRLALRASEVQVPDFTNRTANEASGAAAGLGLALKVDDMKRTDTKIGAGRILAQEPAAGSTARRQRTVKVWLSAGPRATIVPVLTGESERTAQLRQHVATSCQAQDSPARGRRRRGERGDPPTRVGVVGLRSWSVASMDFCTWGLRISSSTNRPTELASSPKRRLAPALAKSRR